jgi:hypothetical protein
LHGNGRFKPPQFWAAGQASTVGFNGSAHQAGTCICCDAHLMKVKTPYLVKQKKNEEAASILIHPRVK